MTQEKKHNIVADGTLVTILFAIGMVVGVGAYIRELHLQLERMDKANQMLARQVVKQEHALRSMQIYYQSHRKDPFQQRL
jgi:hypothetical protein